MQGCKSLASIGQGRALWGLCPTVSAHALLSEVGTEPLAELTIGRATAASKSFRVQARRCPVLSHNANNGSVPAL